MNSDMNPAPSVPAAPRQEANGKAAAGAAADWSSEAIFRGQREVLIVHGAERYRLRITGSNKLILTK
jgi:hemin uptake protein HemP